MIDTVLISQHAESDKTSQKSSQRRVSFAMYDQRPSLSRLVIYISAVYFTSFQPGTLTFSILFNMTINK